MRKTYSQTSLMLVALVAASLVPEGAMAQAVFDAPTSFLTQIRTFITGAGGILLAGVVIAFSAIAAASPRSNFNWGQFFIVLIVVSIFFGAFKIAEVLQTANAN